ncbi:acyltransferase domain-containing protein [Streptomyces sp. NRRL S-1868]|uniref:acyltransferase domain-containing protein n=1 Tax=Streptomyces sp. NRRL S-1868 TaxID=1463892 RepID=UPI00099C8914|nr:acyltransferase domain-containing protein [Streptomyces sp. NRRL S-1868]
MSIAFLFPGLGAQRAGMLHRLPDTAAAATVLAEAEWAHPGGVAELDTAAALEESEVARHVALLTAGVAGARALTEDEGVTPDVVAGYGLGGFAAAVTAGLLTLEEALRAVRVRAELLERAEESVHDIGIRMAQHLATVRRRTHSVAYVTTTGGQVLRGDANGVFDDLARCVALPPAGERIAAALAADVPSVVVELPPGRELGVRLGLAEADEEPPGEDAGAPDGLRLIAVEEAGIAEAARAARVHRDPAAGAGAWEDAEAPADW